jgi:aspartyl-tRNA(Asn)/glutamyl-tRNA(Gln) amidotransferase subunit B
LGSDYEEKIKNNMPELPIERLKRYVDVHKLSDHVSDILINNKKVSDFYEESLKIYNSPKEISNWIVNELLSKTNELEKDDSTDSKSNKHRGFISNVTPQQIADIAKLVEKKSINRNIAKDIFGKSIKTGESPLKLIENIEIEKIQDSETIIKYIGEVLSNEKHLIEQSRTNPKVANFILGKIMKKTGGRSDPQLTLKLIRESIERE